MKNSQVYFHTILIVQTVNYGYVSLYLCWMSREMLVAQLQPCTSNSRRQDETLTMGGLKPSDAISSVITASPAVTTLKALGKESKYDFQDPSVS